MRTAVLFLALVAAALAAPLAEMQQGMLFAQEFSITSPVDYVRYMYVLFFIGNTVFILSHLQSF